MPGHIFKKLQGIGVHSVLNVKVLVAAFNLKKALVGAVSMIVQLCRLIVYSTTSATPTLSSSEEKLEPMISLHITRPSSVNRQQGSHNIALTVQN